MTFGVVHACWLQRTNSDVGTIGPLADRIASSPLSKLPPLPAKRLAHQLIERQGRGADRVDGQHHRGISRRQQLGQITEQRRQVGE